MVTLANEEEYFPSSSDFVMHPCEPNYFGYVQEDQDGVTSTSEHVYYNKQTCQLFYIINAFFYICPVLQQITHTTVLLPDVPPLLDVTRTKRNYTH
jgi:hypothetical protein